MTDYRWNQTDNARGYDAAAEFVHPHYHVIQDVVLEHLPLQHEIPATIVDLGGGSGRLAERILDRFPHTTVWVVDQSSSFLALAEERLDRFGRRAICALHRLQDDWSHELHQRPRAIVSMSAIHHLDGPEKQRLYQQCADCLVSRGVLINGDEVRPEHDAEYLALCRRWARHMQEQMQAGRIPEPLHGALLGWEERNVARFDQPRVSGEDCHETTAAQLDHYRRAGLTETSVVWQQQLWSVLLGIKP